MDTVYLVVNSGSSTVKYSFFQKRENLLRVVYEKHGATYHRQINDLKPKKITAKIFRESFQDLFKLQQVSALKTASKIKIGFRYVHGGKEMKHGTKVNTAVLKKLQKLDALAPLHNPQARKLVEQARATLPKASAYLFFDTAYHRTIPEEHYRYPIPKKLEKKGIRKYGFHGLVCSSIVHQLKEQRLLKKNLILCHLGSGCSVTAIKAGESFHTSMGMTPLEGLMMSTRSGDIDPGALLYLLQKENMSPEKISEMLNEESGLKAFTGSRDMRVALKKEKKDAEAQLGVEIFCNKVAEYIARYTMSLGGLDQIVFSGGIGENAHSIRERVCEKLKPLGVRLSMKKNKKGSPLQSLQKSFSKIQILKAHADEASEIHRLMQEMN